MIYKDIMIEITHHQTNNLLKQLKKIYDYHNIRFFANV
jgi:hypothetical protein